MRWLVERTENEFEDVGAEFFVVKDGCLIFYPDHGDGKPNYVLAAGHWITVCEAAE